MDFDAILERIRRIGDLVASQQGRLDVLVEVITRLLAGEELSSLRGLVAA